jgi:RNAse (barnase) inhibitor barstar
MVLAFAKIDCDRIHDWTSFHDEFKRAFGFPDFYGMNMDAWIDCMTSLDASEDRMTSIHCEPEKVLTLELTNVKGFMARCPEQYAAVVEGSAFVNWRRIERGKPSVLALSFCV